MRIDGSCHCGAITFRAEADPTSARICHCSDCQALSGGAFRTVVPVAEEDFELLSGDPKIYVKIADSGNRRIQAFCGTCGSAIYATSAGEVPRTYGIRLGTVMQRSQIVPRRQYWARSALHWLECLKDIEKVDGNNRPGRAKSDG